MSDKLDISFLGQPVRRKGSQLFFNCPFHEDTHGHLGVNISKQVYHCFKCNASGRLKELEAPLSNFKKQVEDFLFGEPGQGRAAAGNEPLLELPKEYQEVTKQSGLPYRYLKSRDIYENEIRKYRIGYCGEGLFRDRIIIPVYQESALKYYVGRTYTNAAPKYMNASIPKGGTIFKTFNKREEKAIVCEGIFDALRIGKIFPAISILGKVLNGSAQIHSIVKSTKKAYMMLDSDAEKDGFMAANILNYYIPTQVMFIKKKDPGSMTIEELKEMLPR